MVQTLTTWATALASDRIAEGICEIVDNSNNIPIPEGGVVCELTEAIRLQLPVGSHYQARRMAMQTILEEAAYRWLRDRGHVRVVKALTK